MVVFNQRSSIVCLLTTNQYFKAGNGDFRIQLVRIAILILESQTLNDIFVKNEVILNME
jgi:hypothetical protein